jgi:hypothetical protein
MSGRAVYGTRAPIDLDFSISSNTSSVLGTTASKE